MNLQQNPRLADVIGRYARFVVFALVIVLIAVEKADASEEMSCKEGVPLSVTVRMDSGDRLKLHPKMLLGNGLDDLLDDNDVVCGRKEILMQSVRIAIQYLAKLGEIDAGNWDGAAPPLLSLSATYGASRIYEGDVGRFNKLKFGQNWRSRVQASCRISENGFEYCGASCPEDPDRPGYCENSEHVIADWAFIIIDRRANATGPAAMPLIIRCDQLSILFPDGSRKCTGMFSPSKGLFASYRFNIIGEHDIYAFDFGSYQDRIQNFLDGILLD